MNEFTASNGVTVIEHPEYISARSERGDLFIGGNLLGHALKQYVDHKLATARAEEDERLGRWRWPENPDYVVYETRNVNGDHKVIRESDGHGTLWGRDMEPAPLSSNCLEAAACAYFDAHPEPKPWYDAQPGEVWVITTSNVGEERAVQVTPQRTFQYNDAIDDFPLTYEAIQSARRIWPESS